MSLATMEPNPVWNADAHEGAVSTFADAEGIEIHVWGGDWCGDCRDVLPDFAAAMDAAGVPENRIHHHPLDRDKRGELVAEYGIERIPTIVLERDGEELARFVESEPVPAVVFLAERLEH